MIRYVFLIATAIVGISLVTLVMVLPTPDQTAQADSAKVNHDLTSNNYIFTNVNIFDGKKILNKQTLVVTKGKIESISSKQSSVTSKQSAYTNIDATGLTLIPGIIDAHTHTYGNGLSDALRFGVTTHLDMFSAEDNLVETTKKRESLARSEQADLFSSGTLATVDGGHGTQYGFAIDTIEKLEDVASWVGKRKQAGVDYIKLVYMPYQNYMPSLSRELAKEVITQAHAQDMQVLAHISTHKAAQDMIEDGIDGLVHVFADKLVSGELLSLAKQRKIFIIPTLAVVASADNKALSQGLINNEEIAAYLSSQQISTLSADFGAEIPGFSFDIAKQNVKRFFSAGVPILSGSDAPNPGTAYGISALHETNLLVDAGLSPIQALAAATSETARLFNLTGRGRIAVGERADLVLLKGDPSKDINALYNIKSVYKNGFALERALDTSKQTGETIKDTILGDFSQDHSSANGLATFDGFLWSHSDDSMANGKSRASIEVVTMPSNASVLKVNASVNAGFPYPWSGAAVGDFTPPIEGKNLSLFKQLTFEVKGTPGEYRLMGFSANNAGMPPSHTFTVDNEWQTLSIPLSALAGLDLNSVSGFAFVAGPGLGEFVFYLDNVKVE